MAEITEREFYGSKLELIFYGVLIFGSPILMLVGIQYYPLVDANHPVYWKLPLITASLSFILFVLFRKRIFSWGDKMPWLMWVSSVALSCVIGMLILGMVLVLNAGLDSAGPKSHDVVVIDKHYIDGGYSLEFNYRNDTSSRIDVSEQAYVRVSTGEHIRLNVCPGYFGWPWVLDYETGID